MSAARPAILILIAAGSVGLGALLAGCKEEETRPTVHSEMKSSAPPAQPSAQATPPQTAPNAAAASTTSTPTPPTATAAGAPPAGYLPPSENGAEVQITESPVSASRTPKSAPQSAAPSMPATPAPSSGGQVPPGAAARASGGPENGPPPSTRAPSGAASNAPADASGAAALSATAARTSGEQAAALHQDLQRKLQEFDGLMRKAQANAARERAALEPRDGSPDSHAQGGAGGLLEAPPEEGAGGAASAASGLGNTPDLSGETRGARPAMGGRSAANLPNGADDDIVSRQLREAAEREADPVLRDKLWDEYRKYKGGL